MPICHVFGEDCAILECLEAHLAVHDSRHFLLLLLVLVLQ